jgi:hypothetical protein
VSLESALDVEDSRVVHGVELVAGVAEGDDDVVERSAAAVISCRPGGNEGAVGEVYVEVVRQLVGTAAGCRVLVHSVTVRASG